MDFFMEEEYLKEEKIKERTEEEKNKELLLSISKTEKMLREAHMNFEFAESGLIDYYSYNIKAYQSKLDYLIKLAKSRGLKVDLEVKNELDLFREVS